MVKIDIEEMQSGAEVGEQLRGNRTGGIPWFTILDSAGNELISSDGPEGNIGCPVSKQECSHFVAMMAHTIQHAPQDRIDVIAEALDAFAQKRR